MKTKLDFELTELSHRTGSCYILKIFNSDFLPTLQHFCVEKLSLQKEHHIRYADGRQILEYFRGYKDVIFTLGSDIVKDNGYGVSVVNLDAYMKGQEHGRKYNLEEIISHTA